ncbi:MAG TPA: leucyl aminopeptidase, partial [Beijerinckiaceae bacterium]
MAASVKIDFQPFGQPSGDLVVFVGDDLKVAGAAAGIAEGIGGLIAGAAGPERFKGKPNTALAIPAPAGLKAERLIAVGIGGEADRGKLVFADLGGLVAAKLSGRSGTVVADLPGLSPSPEDVAQMALGARLRLYKFDRYKTKKKDDENGGQTRIAFAVADPAAARKSAKVADGLAEGVRIARDLVNEPPNVLGPEEFAKRAGELSKLGVEVEILDEKALKKIGMRALLAVGQGSARESRVVIMRWNGGKGSDKPVAFVGKGVVFDSGGISIKPGGGMEDMKGDMAGAACVVGLMHALAARKARANVIGAIGLVENMPDGAAQRPGDIVTTLSGQTVEIINTDAEGRLVLGDLLWHVQERYKPKFMVDLATLTGAILVALAQEYAGMFSNDDELAQRLFEAGQATGEKVWRMPLGPAYDKLIDSKFADMKNTGGRHGGAVTAAQFLQR